MYAWIIDQVKHEIFVKLGSDVLIELYPSYGMDDVARYHPRMPL